MNGRIAWLLALVLPGLILYLWYRFTRKLPGKYQFLISVCVVVLLWTWEANTAMVLQRVGRYCLDEPMWPPFSGHTVVVPQSIMLMMSLLACGSLGMAVRAFVKLAERSEPGG